MASSYPGQTPTPWRWNRAGLAVETMIWHLWTAFDPVEVTTFRLHDLWNCEDDDGPYEEVAWLGEGAWVHRLDNTGLGLLG